MSIASFYVTFLCAWRTDLLGLLAGLPWLDVALEFIAGQHLVPLALVVASLAAWFGGTSGEHRQIRQQALLRALLAAGLACGLAVLVGTQAGAWLRVRDWEARVDGACWIGAPFPSLAAAAGFALGAALWRCDWRWGSCCLAIVALWTVARVVRGSCYPLDVITGAVIGLVPGWIVGWAGWLDRPLDSIVRFLRRMALA